MGASFTFETPLSCRGIFDKGHKNKIPLCQINNKLSPALNAVNGGCEEACGSVSTIRAFSKEGHCVKRKNRKGSSKMNKDFIRAESRRN
jgi:hypothetical protein